MMKKRSVKQIDWLQIEEQEKLKKQREAEVER